jgi:hypothetical protein
MADRRLIDANALEASFEKNCSGECDNCEHYRIHHASFAKWEMYCGLIRKAPAIDAVEVVRCRECMNWQKDWECTRGKPGDHYCTMIDLVTEPDFYCKHGVKMDGGAEGV